MKINELIFIEPKDTSKYVKLRKLSHIILPKCHIIGIDLITRKNFIMELPKTFVNCAVNEVIGPPIKVTRNKNGTYTIEKLENK